MTNEMKLDADHSNLNNLFDASALLEDYAFLFGLAGKAFYAYPDREWIDSLATQRVFEELASVCSDAETCGGLCALAEWSRENSNGIQDEHFENLEADYVRLFINGNKAVFAPPWESVYTNAVPTLFQCSTMNVRAWYKRYGLVIENVNHEPDDHIGLEFSFVSHLCATASNFAKAADVVKYDKTMADLAEFAVQHVFAWAPHWCDMVESKAETEFFRGVSAFAQWLMASLANSLDVEVRKGVFR